MAAVERPAADAGALLTTQVLPQAFVPIPVAVFQRAYAAALHVLSGNLDFAPGVLQLPPALEGTAADTRASRAWYMGSLLFVDPAERASFQWRITHVLPLIEDRRYRKYRGSDPFSLHIALLRALCSVRGSPRMTKKALRAAFDAELRVQLGHIAAGAEPSLGPHV